LLKVRIKYKTLNELFVDIFGGLIPGILFLFSITISTILPGILFMFNDSYCFTNNGSKTMALSGKELMSSLISSSMFQELNVENREVWQD
jgi:hypothetical protein